jgi:dipeptide/tripeptide permease
LPLYLADEIGLSEDNATAVVHGFIFLSYTFAILGGWLSDTHLGKFKTILSVLPQVVTV